MMLEACTSCSSGTARRALLATVLAAGLMAAQYAPSAEARCCWRGGGLFLGGAIVGAAIARPYYWAPPAYWYAPPPVYYSYAPPPVLYAPPPPVVYSSAPAYVEQPRVAAPAALSIEDRLRRLRSLCDQGLLTSSECSAKREQLLGEM